MEDVEMKSQLTLPVIFQMLGLVSSGLVSWISSTIILIVILTRNSYPIKQIYWLHIVIMPVNANIVPFNNVIGCDPQSVRVFQIHDEKFK